jgi:hypothetical protein
MAIRSALAAVIELLLSLANYFLFQKHNAAYDAVQFVFMLQSARHATMPVRNRVVFPTCPGALPRDPALSLKHALSYLNYF